MLQALHQLFSEINLKRIFVLCLDVHHITKMSKFLRKWLNFACNSDLVEEFVASVRNEDRTINTKFNINFCNNFVLTNLPTLLLFQSTLFVSEIQGGQMSGMHPTRVHTSCKGKEDERSRTFSLGTKGNRDM
jgi:hypothetical protein